MREIRLSGSEGGAAELNRPSLPLSGIWQLGCGQRLTAWFFPARDPVVVGGRSRPPGQLDHGRRQQRQGEQEQRPVKAMRAKIQEFFHALRQHACCILHEHIERDRAPDQRGAGRPAARPDRLLVRVAKRHEGPAGDHETRDERGSEHGSPPRKRQEEQNVPIQHGAAASPSAAQGRRSSRYPRFRTRRSLTLHGSARSGPPASRRSPTSPGSRLHAPFRRGPDSRRAGPGPARTDRIAGSGCASTGPRRTPPRPWPRRRRPRRAIVRSSLVWRSLCSCLAAFLSIRFKLPLRTALRLWRPDRLSRKSPVGFHHSGRRAAARGLNRKYAAVQASLRPAWAFFLVDGPDQYTRGRGRPAARAERTAERKRLANTEYGIRNREYGIRNEEPVGVVMAPGRRRLG